VEQAASACVGSFRTALQKTDAAINTTPPFHLSRNKQAGAFKIGDTAGTLDNIIACKLYRPGSVGFVSKSGGMSNELYNVLSRATDGLYEGGRAPWRSLQGLCTGASFTSGFGGLGRDH